MNITLTEDEFTKLVERFGADGADDWITTLSLQKKARGYKYRSDYHAVLSWARKDEKKSRPVRLAHLEFEAHSTTHLCLCCALDHKWDCSDDPICSLPYEIPCRSFIKGRKS